MSEQAFWNAQLRSDLYREIAWESFRLLVSMLPDGPKKEEGIALLLAHELCPEGAGE